MFEGTEKKDTFKFKHERNWLQYELNKQTLQIIKNLPSARNVDDASQAKNHFDDLAHWIK